jgi:hypothetical protein
MFKPAPPRVETPAPQPVSPGLEALRAAFIAGYAACDKAWRFNPLTSDPPPSRAAACADYLARLTGGPQR